MTRADERLLTTGAAAKLLGTSRQHVVNLCDRGDLRCVHVGSHRRVPQTDIEDLLARTATMTRDQVRSLWLGYAVAGRLVADPDSGLSRARTNLAHLQSLHTKGQAARWLREWEHLLDGPLDKVLEVLTSKSVHARELRQNSPFAGLLPDSERQAVLAASRRVTNVFVA